MQYAEQGRSNQESVNSKQTAWYSMVRNRALTKRIYSIATCVCVRVSMKKFDWVKLRTCECYQTSGDCECGTDDGHVCRPRCMLGSGVGGFVRPFTCLAI